MRKIAPQRLPHFDLQRVHVIRQMTVALLGTVFLMTTPQAMALNPVQIENAIPAKPEDEAWKTIKVPSNPHDIEGYADKVSVQIGQKIKFFANVNSDLDQQYALTIYRLGWYHGVGARQVMAPVTRTSVKQVLPTPDPVTGLVEANWTDPYTLTVPAAWVSGVYVVVLTGTTTGFSQYVPFVVKNDNSFAQYLFQTSDTTWQAYNSWGGKSLYAYNSTNGLPAYKVSYNRPYDIGAGMGSVSAWELQMLRFLEKEGYDVTYQSNVDTHIGGMYQLTKHSAFLSVGHDEYWSKEMRNNVENTKFKGLSLGFFGANAAYWKIRFEPSQFNNDPYRTIVAYKEVARTQDPYALDTNVKNDSEITTLWRDTRYVNRPENALIGIMYVAYPVNSDIVVSAADHWVYTGTGLKNGDKLPGILGYEVDGYVSNGKAPSSLQILAHSPFTDRDNNLNYSDMSIYSQNCVLWPCVNLRGFVFATGSMQWNWGLDSFWASANVENPAVQRITRNVLARMVGNALPSN